MEFLALPFDGFHAPGGEAAALAGVAEADGAAVFVDFVVADVALLVAGVGAGLHRLGLFEVEAGQADFAGDEAPGRGPLGDGVVVEDAAVVVEEDDGVLVDFRATCESSLMIRRCQALCGVRTSSTNLLLRGDGGGSWAIHPGPAYFRAGESGSGC